MTRTRPGAFAVIVLAHLAAAACGEPAAEPPPEDAAPRDGVFGRVAPAVGGIPSVVSLEPVGEEYEAPATSPGATPTVDQRGLQFTPSRLVVRVGDTVRFTNSESVAHNVHVRISATDSTVLNEDTPAGGSLRYVVEQPGGYDVLCDVHPGMTAYLFATSAPWAVFAEQDGSFQIPRVPPGTYQVSVWSLDEAARWQREVVVREGTATEVSPG